MTRVHKRPMGVDVLTAARTRISQAFDDFPRVYVSFSGGKDSGVLLELAACEARRRGRRLGMLFVDLEAQYELTVAYIQEMIARHADVLEVYWVALPLNLRNAVSHFEPEWMCWDSSAEDRWVRRPPEQAVTDEDFFDFFWRRMEFEDFTPAFADWYSRQGQGEGPELTCCLVGIRTQESLNRWRTIASQKKRRFGDYPWTTWIAGTATYNAYPIYDWATEDVWRYYGRHTVPYNRLYDRMHQAGLTIHQQRICQPYGDDQRRGLWLYHIIEPHTWTRVVARVQGADFGATYARDTGNMTGRVTISKPEGLTWQEYARRLLHSMPPPIRDHYEDKITQFLAWYSARGYPGGEIPDTGSPTDKSTPSWTRICKVLLSYDYWCKGLSFSPNNLYARDQYKALMKKRRAEYQFLASDRR